MKTHARLGSGLLKGIQVDHHHVDGHNSVFCHRLLMLLIVANVEYSAMHLGVQGLHPSIQHLGEPRQLRDVLYRNTRIPQQLGRASGGDQLYPELMQFPGKVLQPGLIGNT